MARTSLPPIPDPVQVIQEELRRVADQASRDAAASVPVVTGRLRDSMVVSEQADGVSLGNTAPYALHYARRADHDFLGDAMEPAIRRNEPAIARAVLRDAKKHVKGGTIVLQA